jgi:hypothetical protein
VLFFGFQWVIKILTFSMSPGWQKLSLGLDFPWLSKDPDNGFLKVSVFQRIGYRYG